MRRGIAKVPSHAFAPGFPGGRENASGISYTRTRITVVTHMIRVRGRALGANTQDDPDTIGLLRTRRGLVHDWLERSAPAISGGTETLHHGTTRMQRIAPRRERISRETSGSADMWPTDVADTSGNTDIGAGRLHHPRSAHGRGPDISSGGE